MKKVTRKIQSYNGVAVRRNVYLPGLLNLNIVRLLHKAKLIGRFGLPQIQCDTLVYPDFLAVYKERGLYTRTRMTGVCFYSFDKEFDGENGLFNAIFYNNEKRLAYFKERFKDVKFLVTPDYSVFGDIPFIENLYRIFRARIVALWFILELKAVVIPNISYGEAADFPVYFTGLENCSVVAFNTKGHMKYNRERNLLKSAVKYAVDNLPLKTILVYSVCGKDETCLEIFNYAIENGIQVRIVNNTLRERNLLRRGA